MADDILGSFTTDAVTLSPDMPGSFDVSASVPGWGDFSAWAVIHREMPAATFQVWASIPGWSDFTVDAVISRTIDGVRGAPPIWSDDFNRTLSGTWGGDWANSYTTYGGVNGDHVYASGATRYAYSYIPLLDTLTYDPVDATVDFLTPAAGGGTSWRFICRLRRSYFQVRALNPPVARFNGNYDIYLWSGGFGYYAYPQLDASTWYRVRMQRGADRTKLKIWKAEELEPSDWLIADAAVGGSVTSSYLLLDAYGNDARADNLYIWPLGYDSYYDGIQVDAAIYPRHFRVDAALFEEMSASTTIDAIRGEGFETTGVPVEYQWGPGGSFPIAAVILATISESGYGQLVLRDHPLHYWRLNETSGSTAVDIGSAPIHGTVKSGVTVGVPTIDPAPPGTAFSFPGDSTTGYVWMEGVSVAYPAYSYEAWAKIENGWSGAIAGRGYSTGSMLYWSGGGVSFYHYGNSTYQDMPAGDWHHVAAVYDGSYLRVYVDGAPGDNPRQQDLATPDPGYAWAIGAYNATSSSSYSALNGLIGEVAFYDYALSQEQISTHVASLSGTLFVADAVICDRNFKANAALFREMSGSFAVDAVLRDTFSFGPVPVEYEWGPGGWFDLDSIRLQEILGSIGQTPETPVIAPNSYLDAVDWFPSLSVGNTTSDTKNATGFLADYYSPVYSGYGYYRGWIKLVIPAGGSLTAQFDTNGSTYDTILTLYSPDGVGSVLTGDDDGGDGAASLITATLAGGHTHYLLCSSYGSSTSTTGTMVMRITPTAASGQPIGYTVGIKIDAVRGQTFTPSFPVEYEWGPGGSFAVAAILLTTVFPTSLAPYYWLDDFNRVVASGWGGTWNSQYNSYYASVDGSQGRVTDNTYSYAYNTNLDAIMAGVPTWDTTVEFRTPPVGGSTSWRFQWRVPDSYFYLYPYTTIASPTSAYRVYLYGKGLSTTTTTFQVAPDTWYRARLQQGAGTSYLRIWKLTDPEPETWLLTRTQSTTTYSSYLSVQNYSTTSYAAFDNMAVWEYGKWGLQPGFTVDAYYEWLHFYSYATFLRTQAPAAKTLDAVKRDSFTGTPFVLEYEWGPGGAITLDAVILATVESVGNHYGKIVNSVPDAFWPFDDATTTSANEVMAGNTATPVTPANISTAWADGIGKGWQWSGATYLNTLFYQPSTYAATFEGWIKVSAASPGELWQGRYGSGGGGGRGITVAMNANGYGTIAGRINFFLNSDSIWRGVTTTNAYNDGQLHHVVCVFDSEGAVLNGNQFKVYVDGYQVAAPVVSSTGSPVPPYAGRANGQFLGRNYGAFTGGFASHFAFYSRALTPDEILDHYLGGGFQVQALLIPMFFKADAFFIGTVYRDVTVDAVITRTWDPSDGMVIPVEYEWGPGGEFVPGAIKLRIQEGFGDLVFPGWDSLGVGPGGRANMLTPVPVRVTPGTPFSITFTQALSDGGNIGYFAGPTDNMAAATENSYGGVGAIPYTFTATVKAGNYYVWPYSWSGHTYRPALTGAGYHVPGRILASAIQKATINVYGTLFLTEDDPNRHGTIDAFYTVVYTGSTTLDALILANIQGVSIPYADKVLASSPVAYWQLNELSGTVAEDSAGTQDGTYTGVTLRQSGPTTVRGGSVLLANNDSSYIPTGAPTGLPLGNADRTIEAWFKTTATDRQVIFGYGNSSTLNQFLVLTNYQSADLCVSLYNNDGGVNVGDIESNGNWHHLAVTYTGSSHLLSFYLDGVFRGTRDPGTNINTSLVGSAIGRLYYEGGFNFGGNLAHVAVYPTVLDPETIAFHAIGDVGIRTDAIIYGLQAGTPFSLDAVLLDPNVPGTPFTVDYEWGPGGWFGLDAIPLATIDDSASWVNPSWVDPSLVSQTAFGVGAWISAIFTTDAEIWPLHFWARASIGLWFWAEAEISLPYFRADAVSRATFTGTPFTADARIIGTVYGSFVARAVKRETFTGTPFTIDADKSGRLDLYATKMRDTWGALRVFAGIKRTWLKDFPLDFEWGPGGDFTLNAYRQPYFFVDAELCLAFELDATILAWQGSTFLPLSYPGTSQSLLGQTVNALTPQFSIGPDELMNVTVTVPPSDGGILGAFRLGSAYNYDIPAVVGEHSFPVLPGEYVIYSASGNVYRPSLGGSGTYQNWGFSTLGITVDAFIQPTFRVNAAIVWIITPTPFTVGAWFKRIWVYGFPAGAFVLPWFTLDATYVPRHFHASAWLIRRPGGSFTANAFIEWRHFHANAVRRSTQLKSFRVNAFFDHPIYGDFNVYSRINWYFPVAAAFTVARYRKFTVSAVKRWLVQPPIVDWDRWWAYPPVLPVVSAFVQPYFRIDARIFRMEFFLSAVILREQEKSFTAGANFVWTFLGSTTANAFVLPWFKLYAVRRWEPSHSLNVMSWMVRLVTASLTVNAELRGTWAKAVILHPDMRGVFTFYAVKAQAMPVRTFPVQAEKVDPGAYWDPETEAWLHPHFTIDAGIAFFTGGMFVMDAAIVEDGLVIHSFVPSAMIFGERTDMFWIEAMVDAEKTIVYERDGYTEQVLTTFTERLTFPGWNDSIGGGSNRVSSFIDNTASGERVSFTVWSVGWKPVDGSCSIGFVSVHENLWTSGPCGGGPGPEAQAGDYQAYGNTYSFIPQYPDEPRNAYVWTSLGGYQSWVTGDVLMTYKRWMTVVRSRPAPTIDAYLVGTTGEPFSLDAEIVEYEKLRSFVLYAESCASGEHRGQVEVDASILGSVSLSWWVDAILEGLHFHADAVIHQPGIAVSAFVQPHFKVDALVLFTRQWTSGLPTINAVKYLPTPTGSFTVGADINVEGQPRGLVRLDALILADRGWRIYVIAYIQAPDWSFGVDAMVAPSFAASAWIQPYFTVSAQIRGDSYIIFPEDGGDPTDAHGNPPRIGRSFKVKIEAFIPDEVPVGNDAEIERLIWLILEAEAELDAMYCAYTHFSSQDQTTSGSHGHTNPNQAGTGRTSTLPGALSQVGYPGAGDVDDCWAVATIWAANAAGYSYRPNMTLFRAEARNPDRPGPTGGTLDHVMRGARGCYPSAHIRRYHSTSWDGFISLLKAGWVGSLAVLSSALPSDLHYGFHGRHQIGVAYQNGTYYVMNPLQNNGARPDAISGADLRRAARGFTGGTISACLFS